MHDDYFDVFPDYLDGTFYDKAANYKQFVNEHRKTGYAIAATSTAIGAVFGYKALKELANRDKAENTSVAKPLFALAIALGAITLGGYTAVTMHR